jgi:hypothetical protein
MRQKIIIILMSLSIYSPLLELGPLFSVSLSYIQSVGLLGRGISPSQGRYVHMTTQIQNKRTQTSMPWVWFEPMIPDFERAKIVRDSDRAATVIGIFMSLGYSFSHSLHSQVAVLSNFSIIYTKPHQSLIENLNKQTPWFQSAKRTIPTERPPLVGEVSANFSG